MVVVADEDAGESQEGVGRTTGDARALPVCEVRALMTLSHTAIHVHSSG